MKKRSLGIFLSYANTILSMVFGLVLSSFLLKSLGDTEYGIYQSVTAFATYLVMLEFGTGTVMQRSILLYKGKNDNNAVNRCISTIWFATIGLSLLMLFVSYLLYSNLDLLYINTMTAQQVVYAKQMFCFVIGYIISVFFTQAFNGVLIGMENYTFTQWVNIFKVTLRSVSIILLVLFIRYSIVIAVVDFCVNGICFILTYIYSIKRYNIKISLNDFDYKIIRDSLPLCLALLLQSFLQLANNSVDRTIISVSMSLESVTLYSVAQYIFTIFVSVCIAPITMYLPQIAKNLSLNLCRNDYTDTFVPACRLTAILGGTIICGFFAIGNQFITLFYGPTKTDAWLFALILMIPDFFFQTNDVLINVLDLTKKRLARSIILGFSAVVNVVLTVFLIQYSGILGAVTATAISTILGCIMMNIYYQKVLNINVLRLYYKSYTGILPFQIFSSIIAYLIAERISGNFISFFVGGFSYVIISFCLIFAFGLKDEEKQILLRKINRLC